MKIKYGDYTIEITKKGTFNVFTCPICGLDYEVDGHILHCRNRIHQHLCLDHKYGPYQTEELN